MREDAAPTPKSSQSQPVRCAVYTRASVDDRRDGEFSSTAAQFMACHELITSQLAQGWRPIDRLYEDRGHSGSHLDRPGMMSLMADIEQGRVDIVVVHRLDRLTRYMGDLQRLLDLFGRHGVGLVSVTQSLDTTHQQGRLVINLLTSFAQFERELIGDRIRETRAATRRQGFWYGSASPLGYVIVQQKLVVDPQESAVVRDIFARFLTQPSVTALVQELADRGVRTKRWRTKAGALKGGATFDKNALYKLLNNRVYLGELYYDDQWHASTHEAIIDRDLWDRVHERMASRARRTGVGNKQQSNEDSFWLKGRVFGTDQHAMTPWLSSSRRGRHYPYYVPQLDIALGAGKSGLPRLPAGELHASVLAYLREGFRNPDPWFAALPPSLTQRADFDPASITQRLRNFDQMFDLLFPQMQRRVLRQLVDKVVIGKDQLVIQISPQGIAELMVELLDQRVLQTAGERPAPDGETPSS